MQTKLLRAGQPGRQSLFLVIMLLLFNLSSWAAPNEKAIIEFKQASLKEVLSKIESTFKVGFTYDPTITEGNETVSLAKKERSLSEVLEQVGNLTGLKFMQVGKMIGIQKANKSEKFAANNLSAEDVTIKGRVLDASNQPMSGISVSVKGTGKGVVTNTNGEFTITVQKGETLVFTAAGFQPQELVADRNMTQDISLAPIEKALEEVVVTALGVRKEKAKVAYAMQEVKGDAIQKAPESNIANNLVGKVAGLSVYTKSTLFENPEILLRGQTTLVVIDGVPTQTDFWNLNANDIESVNVLKGTAAAALYGSLGINGAIMITTKKGKGGANGLEITYNTSNQFQAGFLNLPKTQKEYGMGWDGLYGFVNGKGANGLYDDYGYVWGPKLNQPDPTTASGFTEYPQWNSPYDPNQLFSFIEKGTTYQSHYQPTPWISKGQNNLKNFLNNEFSTTHNISVSGKTDKSDYRISLSHTYQKGQVPNTKLNSTTLSLAGSLKITEKLRVEANLSYNKQFTPNYPTTGYGPNNYFYNIMLWMGPDVDIRELKNYWQPAGGRDDNGGFIPYGVKGVQQSNYNYSWYNNPWYLANEYLRGYVNDVIVGQANATYDFNKDLSLMVRTGVTTNHAVSDLKTPYSFINYGVEAAPFGNYENTEKNNFQIVTDALLTYKKKFLRDFTATVSVGGSNRYTQAKYLTGYTVGGLNVPEFYNLSNSRGTQTSLNKMAEKQVASLFGYADIGYKNMVYLNITGRNDWTSTLQKPYHSFFYPSASISIIGSEIVRLPDFISFFKLRASYANISSDIVVPYGDASDIYTNYYGTLPVYTQGTRWNGAASLSLPETLITPGIQPNKTISQEYGAELRFIKNRLGLDFTWFNYLDKNKVKQIPISQASGYSSILLNADEISRKGVEVVVSGTPIRTSNVKWDVIANFSTLRTIAKSYYNGDQIREGVKIGERTDIYRSWGWERSPDGQMVYDDNGFPKYIDHVVNLGNTKPDWEFGFINNVSYKNFSISISFDGRVGGVLYNGVEQKLYEGGMHPATANKFRDESYAGNATYVGEGVVTTSGTVEYDVQGNIVSDTRKFAPNTKAVKYIDWVFNTYVYGIPDANMYKRTFMKLREITLTYNANPKILNRTPFKGASVSLTGRNLALWTKVPFMDPDGYEGQTLADPSYRNIGFNLNLKF